MCMRNFTTLSVGINGYITKRCSSLIYMYISAIVDAHTYTYIAHL